MRPIQPKNTKLYPKVLDDAETDCHWPRTRLLTMINVLDDKS